MVARAAAAGEAKHASKKDVELLKKLSVEFKSELEALGAKTDKLDKRVTKLEKGIGSWQISGRFKFNAKEYGGSNAGGNENNIKSWTRTGKHEWNRAVARMFFRRQITEDTYFDSQFRLGSAWSGTGQTGVGEGSTFSTRKFYVGTKLPFWGLELKIGRTQFDWEGMYDLYTDEDALFGDWRFDGFWFTKKWSKVQADAIFGRGQSGSGRNYAGTIKDGLTLNKDKSIKDFDTQAWGLSGGWSGSATQLYTLNLKWTPTDKWTLGAMAYWMQGDGSESNSNAKGCNMQTYGVTAGYKFTDGIALKGIYYWQHYNKAAKVLDNYYIKDDAGKYVADPLLNGGTQLDENNYAFKVILDIKQSVLKFTDLWVEYAQYKNGFGGNNAAGGWDNGVNCYSLGGTENEPGIQWSRPINNETSKVWFIRAEQKWNKKWSTFVRFNYGNWGTDGIDNAYEWGLGVKYKLNPAITFMLAYDEIKYGNEDVANYLQAGAGGHLTGKDRVVFFQTDVKF